MMIKFRAVVYKETKYLHIEDVISYMQEIAASEETDTRDRLMQAVENISACKNDD